MCQYTSHGHCGIIEDEEILNDETLNYLSKIALSHAEAGADIVAPSDMMDGRVAAIRKTLDLNGFFDTIIMSYSAKYSSSFYAPFRDAVCSAPCFGDRKTYQMSPANTLEALRETELDIVEGADIVMVKPAMPCLDIIKAVKDEFQMPTAAYQVSGEYSMLKAGIDAGYLTNESIYESLLSIKRAGADLIITHFAPEFLEGSI
jgi:porphobilinogen synthase